MGGASVGRGGESVSVNAKSGNLVISRRDEFLAGRGPDAAVSRTYNSLIDAGGSDRDNGDGWHQSTTRRVFGLSGGQNAAGSTINRLGADGSVITYAWETRGGVAAYWSTEGSGSHDKLVKSGSVWIWTDGDSQAVERYQASASTSGEFRLYEVQDISNQKLTITYLSGSDKIHRLTTQNGEWIEYSWSGNNITQVTTRYIDIQDQDGDGNTTEAFSIVRVSYGYDSSNRLTSVTTDLTPENSSDNKTYTTTYTYVGSTDRVATISQTDGSHISVTYDSSNRVQYIYQTIESGVTRRTGFSYLTNVTSVIHDDGTVNNHYFDSEGRLGQINYVAVAGGPITTERFYYDADGNVDRVTNRDGASTYYEHDDRGNITKITDPNGNVTDRVFNAENNLTRETWRGSDGGTGNVVRYSHYIYDGNGRLTFTVDPEGRVAETRYASNGQVQRVVTYPEHRYPGGSTPVSSVTPTNSQMLSWRSALGDRSSTQQTLYYYDARGSMIRSDSFGAATSGGGTTSAEGYSRTHYTYDQGGQLLSSRIDGDSESSFVYDGLGRMVSSVDGANNTISIVFDDAASKTIITNAAGFITTETYNLAGELIQRSENTTAAGANTSSSETADYQYDEMGRLRIFIDERNDRTFYLYNDVGNQTGIVTEDGRLTEFKYDDANRVIATVKYIQSAHSHEATLLNPDHTLEIDDVRPASHSQDLWTWTVYDDGGRVAQTIDGAGAVTAFEYDKANNLVRTTSYWNKVSVAALKTTPPTSPVSVSTNANDIVVRSFYDLSGRQIGALDGEGYLTQMHYDEAGQLVRQTVFKGQSSSSLRANGTFDQLLGSVGSVSRSAHSVYDGRGLLRYQVDELGLVTSFQYDRGERVTQTTAHALAISTSDYTYDAVKAAVSASSADRTSSTIYDSAGRMASVTGPEGLVTTYAYDANNNVKSVTLNDSGVTRTSYSFHDAQGQLKYAVDAEGYVVRFDYDDAGNVTRERQYDTKISVNSGTTLSQVDSAVSGLTYADTQYAYNNQGELYLTTNAEGEKVRDYFRRNDIVSQTRVAQGTGDEAITYFDNDAVGRVWQVRNAFGQSGTQKNGAAGEQFQTRFTFDAFGQTLTVKDGEGNITTNEYDRRGLLTTMTDAEGGVTTYEYNGYGELVKSTDARGNSTVTYYDDLGRVTMVIDAEGYVTETRYNSFGEVDRVVRHWGQYQNADPATKPVFVIDATDNITYFEYDNAGRLTKTTDAEDYVETYSYNRFGERISRTGKSNTDTRVESAADANITTYEYDKRGLLIRETLPAEVVDENDDNRLVNIVNTYAYDARGNQISMTEAEGLAEQRTTTYVYDKVNRLIETRGQARQIYSQTNHLAVSGLHTPTETISYDKRGNITKTVDASGATTVFYYDDLGRKVVEIDALGTYTAYEYDHNSNVERIRIFESQVSVPADGGSQEEAPDAPAGAARETLFEYDKLNRMTKSSVIGVHNGYFNGTSWVANSTNFETLYEYDANGNVTKTTDPMGNTTHAYYDKLGRKIGQVDGENYLTKWEYDSEGNVTKETQYAVKLSSVPATLPSPSTSGARITTYTYDAVGNRLSEIREGVVIHNGSGGTQTVNATVNYEYNGLGQVTKKTEATGDLTEYSYDDGGRLESERRLGDGLTYGFTGHTNTQVTPGVDYSYDGLGNLRWSKALGGAGVAERYTSYDYNSGGLLERMIDAEGNIRQYYYDKSGRQILERYDRTETSGQQLVEGSLVRYDLLGRVTEQWTARWNGTGWTSDSDGSARDTSRVAQTEYNAFGDVSRTGINGTWISENKYDLAGRLWATNAGDGIWKFFGYDKNGNQTIALESAGYQFTSSTTFQTAFNQINNHAVNATFTQYDNRNMATGVFEEQRELTGSSSQSLHTFRTYNAFGEVATETDARGAKLTYTYNTMGRMIRSESPTVEVLYENGSSQWIRPAEDFYYDESGRLVAQRDANGVYATGGNSTTGAVKLANEGNLTRLELLAGTGYSGSEAIITKQIAADGGITRTSFDIHGDARKVEVLINGSEASGTWRTTNQEYDKLGRLTKVTEPNGLVRHYEYDEVGNRTAEWVQGTGLTGYGSGNKQTTDYDKHGQVLRVRAYGGDVTQTTYDWDNTIEAGGTGLVNTGGWIKQTAYANGKTLTETSDVFGRATRKVDLGGNITTYSYDIAGRQTSSQITRSAANGGGSSTATYTYFNTGQIKTNSNNNGLATYEYDASGNRTREKLVQGAVTIKDHTATYDKLGRLMDWNAVATSKAPAASESHDYDANGNIRRTQESFYTLNSTGGQGWLQSGDKWFRFDSMNRVVVQNGERTGGVIRGGTSGLEFSYNIAGERVEQFQTETRYRQEVDPDFDWASWGYEGSNPDEIDYIDVPYDVTIRESYAYNTSGQLTEIWVDEYESNGATAGVPELTVSDVTVNEGGSTTFTIELSSAATSAISVDYATANGTATTADYQSRSGSVTFSAGQTTKNITVQTTSDNTIEGNETFFFNLSNASGATITDGSAQATIIDGVVTPAISISNATAAEGNNLAFTVSLSTASNSSVSVNYGTTNGSATTADYVAKSGTLTFAAGQTSKTVYVSTRTDTINEGNEVMYLDLSAANGGTISDSRGNGTITNVAAATNPVISITGDSGPEGSNTTFLVTLSEASTSSVSVDFATFGISAQSGIDFQSRIGTLTFAAGETAKGINVFLYDDSTFETDETFEVRLANPTGGATLHTSQNIGFGTIFDMTTGGGGGGPDPIFPGGGGTLPFSFSTGLSPEPSLTSVEEPIQSNDTFTFNSDPSTFNEPVSGGATFDPAASNTVASQSATALSGIRRSLFVYDLLGRQIRQDDFNTSGQSVYSQQQFFNAKGQLIETEVSTKRDDGKTYLQHNRFDYGSNALGNYALGNIVQSLSDTRRDNDDGDVPDTATKYFYDWYDSAVQKTIYHDKSYNNSYSDTYGGNGAARGMYQGANLGGFDNDYTTTHYYNHFGQLTSAYVQDGIAKNVTFTLDEAGQVIRRDESVPTNVSQTGSPHEVWYRYGGAEMGYTGNNGTTSVSATDSIAQRTAESPSSSRTGTFRGGKDVGSAYIDGAGALTRFNSYNQGSSVGTYTVRGGESLQQIAATTYGDANLWYKIAEANGLSGSSTPIAGQTLRLPAGVVKTSHNAGTFKPYDPSEAIGELSPTTPKPAKSAKCGVFGAILLAVVSIAVTVIAPFGAGFWAGVANAALGSVASQAVGVATGIQDKFSFKSVGLAALSAGVSGGIGEIVGNGAFAGSQFAGDVLRGAAGSAITQGIGVATGLQSDFSWAGVAAAGVAAGIGGAVTRGLNSGQGNFGSNGSWSWNNSNFQAGFASQLAAGSASLLASAATRSAIEGSSFGKNLIAGLPDVIGQVIGRAAGRGIRSALSNAPENLIPDSFYEDQPQGQAGAANHSHHVVDTAIESTNDAAGGAERQIEANQSQVTGNASANSKQVTGQNAEASIEQAAGGTTSAASIAGSGASNSGTSNSPGIERISLPGDRNAISPNSWQSNLDIRNKYIAQQNASGGISEDQLRELNLRYLSWDVKFPHPDRTFVGLIATQVYGVPDLSGAFRIGAYGNGDAGLSLLWGGLDLGLNGDVAGISAAWGALRMGSYGEDAGISVLWGGLDLGLSDDVSGISALWGGLRMGTYGGDDAGISVLGGLLDLGSNDGTDGISAFYGGFRLGAFDDFAGIDVGGYRLGVEASSASGLGEWRDVNESMSDRARAYEEQITGRRGQAYFVQGVKFDGFSGGPLLEAKGPGREWAITDGEFRSGYRGAAELVDQARRQVAAADGHPIEWHMAEADLVEATQNLFAGDRSLQAITIVHTPFER